MRRIPVLLLFIGFLSLSIVPNGLYGQISEPELRPMDPPKTPFDEDVRNGIGFEVVINNFGFGIGAEYKRVLAPNLEGMLKAHMTGLRDVSEQTFTDLFFGQQVVPNKYQRAFAFPITAGVRHRLFANTIADNYRIYLSSAVGPVFAYSYPYFEDRFDNQFRENFPQLGRVDPVNDVFSGLGEGDWHLGVAGELALNLDIGENFSNLTSIRFGYLFYYFDSGIQIMQPRQPVGFNPEEGEFITEPFFDPQKFFGTPQISFTFGRMW